MVVPPLVLPSFAAIAHEGESLRWWAASTPHGALALVLHVFDMVFTIGFLVGGVAFAMEATATGIYLGTIFVFMASFFVDFSYTLIFARGLTAMSLGINSCYVVTDRRVALIHTYRRSWLWSLITCRASWQPRDVPHSAQVLEIGLEDLVTYSDRFGMAPVIEGSYLRVIGTKAQWRGLVAAAATGAEAKLAKAHSALMAFSFRRLAPTEANRGLDVLQDELRRVRREMAARATAADGTGSSNDDGDSRDDLKKEKPGTDGADSEDGATPIKVEIGADHAASNTGDTSDAGSPRAALPGDESVTVTVATPAAAAEPPSASDGPEESNELTMPLL